jgi:cobaltochelatase CobS
MQQNQNHEAGSASSTVSQSIENGESTAPRRVLHRISRAFGVIAKDTMTLEGYDKPGAFVPKKNQRQVLPSTFFRDIYAFMCSGHIAMKVTGYQGAGKSSGISYIHACLNKPLYSITCHEDTQIGDLIGQWVLQKDGSMKWCDGPVLKAYRAGESVLCNELNALRPGVLLGLNGFLEGETVYIPETEEAISPAPGFRFFATENIDNGSGHFPGRNLQDASVEDRFWSVKVDYMDPEDEIPLLASIFTAAKMDPALATQQATLMVKIANTIRSRFMGKSNAADALEVTMSTRTLVRWAETLILYRGCERDKISPLHFSLMRAMTNRPMQQSTREAIHMLVAAESGVNYQTEEEIATILRQKTIAQREALEAQRQTGQPA